MLSFQTGVTLLGGGPASLSMVRAALALAPNLMAADGGANRLSDVDLIPRAILGDLDSLENMSLWRERLGDDLIHIEEQDSTDFEKCLMRIEAPFFVGVGFLGGRQDHTLAAMHTLVADTRPIVLVGEEDVVFAPKGETRLSLPVGERISLFPLKPVRAIRGVGLTYPIDGLAMAAGAQIGTSNRTSAPTQSFAFDQPGALVFLNADRTEEALLAQGALFQPTI